MKSVHVRAEPAGFSVWILAEDPLYVITHQRHGMANACAAILAKQGGCGGSRSCQGCDVDLAGREELLSA